MAAIASFSVAHEPGNANRLTGLRNLYIPDVKALLWIWKKNEKISSQLATGLVIGWKLKI